MTNEEEINETVKIEMSLDLFSPLQNKLVGKVEKQTVTFMYDKWTKGKRVVMILTSKTGVGIDAPYHHIYLDHKQLEDILKFLQK